MTGRTLRWLVAGFLASGGAGLLTLTATMNAGFAYGSDESAIMGGTFDPDPDLGYLHSVSDLYINPPPSGAAIFSGQPTYPGYTPNQLYTPEQFWPVSGPSDLTFDQSVAQGVGLLDNAIKNTYAGDNLVVFGYSQSATIATNEMRDLMASGYEPAPGTQLSFVLIGDPNNPDGGILERFNGLYIPGLDVSFNGATPPDTPYPTDIYSIQYDGIADAPQFPVNPVSDANAIAGYFEVHGTYPNLTPAELGTAEQLPTSPGYYPDGLTHYYMIPTQDLPLLDPLRDYLPVVGNPLADLSQPDLRVLVDLAYGDGYANVPTTAGLLPLFNPVVVGIDRAKGAELASWPRWWTSASCRNPTCRIPTRTCPTPTRG
ncbi:MAG: PE-PPE domain-containing protein [Mycobacterium sp.]